MDVGRKEHVKQLPQDLACLNQRFNVTGKVTGMGVGIMGRVVGDETWKVAWSQIVKALGNPSKEAGLKVTDNGELIEGLSGKVTQSALTLGR